MESNGDAVSHCNFGGFVPISTVDWPGLAASIIFLRGCPNVCKDCHNRHLLVETTPVLMETVIEDIKCASPFISALIVSGGEPTKHEETIETILRYAKSLQLKTRVQTSGIYPHVIEDIIDKGLVDSIALDFKSDLNHIHDYISPAVPGSAIIRSLETCEKARDNGTLSDFELVHTIFPYGDYEDQLKNISGYASKSTRFILQQGIPRDREVEPLSRDKLRELAEKDINQSVVKIRTRTHGEEVVK